MNYPIIIKRTKDPDFHLLRKNVDPKTKSGDFDYPFYEFLRNENKLPVWFNYSFNKFQPDIFYIDKQKNILIDIEIDEPYSRSGVLTHYLNNIYDHERNDYFINSGVHVIRFSEKQIVTKRELCFETINCFLKSLYDFNYEIKLINFINRIREPIWTRDQAKKMLACDFRDCYPYDVIFTENTTQSIKRDISIDDFKEIQLQSIKDELTIIIPTKLVKLMNPQDKSKAFYYCGARFSNSEYNGFSREITTGNIVDENAKEYKFFEDYFDKRITFQNDKTKFIPLVLFFKSDYTEPFKIEEI